MSEAGVPISLDFGKTVHYLPEEFCRNVSPRCTRPIQLPTEGVWEPCRLDSAKALLLQHIFAGEETQACELIMDMECDSCQDIEFRCGNVGAFAYNIYHAVIVRDQMAVFKTMVTWEFTLFHNWEGLIQSMDMNLWNVLCKSENCRFLEVALAGNRHVCDGMVRIFNADRYKLPSKLSTEMILALFQRFHPFHAAEGIEHCASLYVLRNASDTDKWDELEGCFEKIAKGPWDECVWGALWGDLRADCDDAKPRAASTMRFLCDRFPGRFDEVSPYRQARARACWSFVEHYDRGSIEPVSGVMCGSIHLIQDHALNNPNDFVLDLFSDSSSTIEGRLFAYLVSTYMTWDHVHTQGSVPHKNMEFVVDWACNGINGAEHLLFCFVRKAITHSPYMIRDKHMCDAFVENAKAILRQFCQNGIDPQNMVRAPATAIAALGLEKPASPFVRAITDALRQEAADFLLLKPNFPRVPELKGSAIAIVDTISRIEIGDGYYLPSEVLQCIHKHVERIVMLPDCGLDLDRTARKLWIDAGVDQRRYIDDALECHVQQLCGLGVAKGQKRSRNDKDNHKNNQDNKKHKTPNSTRDPQDGNNDHGDCPSGPPTEK